MDKAQASAHIERELMILTRHREMTTPRAGTTDALDRSAYLLLSRLETEGPMSVGDFVEAFGLAASTFTRQTGALLRNGYAERIPDPAGGMARKYRITALGLERVTAQRAELTASLAHILQDWPTTRLAGFVADLERFNTDIESLTGRPWPRL